MMIYRVIAPAFICCKIVNTNKIAFPSNHIHCTLLTLFRLNAVEYSDLKDKLQTPIRAARDVVIRQSLSDRFLAAFREQVESNPVYRNPPREVFL